MLRAPKWWWGFWSIVCLWGFGCVAKEHAYHGFMLMVLACIFGALSYNGYLRDKAYDERKSYSR